MTGQKKDLPHRLVKEAQASNRRTIYFKRIIFCVA